MYQVKTEKFTGPLGKLLELIEAKKLEITQISLAEVTADFLRYVKELGAQETTGVVADFLVVAAKLLLIKSKVLLPMLELTKEEEEDIHDLEGRLKLYREFKVAAEYVKKLWDKKEVAYGREFLSSLGETSVFYPPKEMAVSDLVKAVRNLTVTLQALIPESQSVTRQVVTIEQKMEELLNRFKEIGSSGDGKQSFRNLADKKSRQEVILLFLAVLHLLKDRVVKVSQSERFSDITMETTTESERAESNEYEKS